MDIAKKFGILWIHLAR